MKRNAWICAVFPVCLMLLAGCGRQEPSAPTLSALAAPMKVPSTALAGSKTCQECHADFYKLWSTSWHGLAMQPYTAAFAKAHLTPQEGDVTIGKRKYRAEVGQAGGLRSRNRPGRRSQIPHRPRHGREERLLPSHAAGSRPPASASLGLRRPQESLVRHGGQRRAAFSRPPRRGPRLDRPHVRVQHHLFQLPRHGTLDQLRPGNRHLPHDVVRAGHQLRVVPWLGQRARARRWRPTPKATRRKISRSSAPRNSRPRR